MRKSEVILREERVKELKLKGLKHEVIAERLGINNIGYVSVIWRRIKKKEGFKSRDEQES